jgi:hypothetical protein
MASRIVSGSKPALEGEYTLLLLRGMISPGGPFMLPKSVFVIVKILCSHIFLSRNFCRPTYFPPKPDFGKNSITMYVHR